MSRWSIRLSDAAEQDFRDIYLWTDAMFGRAQAEKYATALSNTIDALQAGPKLAGIKSRNDVARGVWSLSVRIRRRRASHQIFFRIAERDREIVVLRVLHDAMHPARHLAQ